jgi:hypothetical protein
LQHEGDEDVGAGAQDCEDGDEPENQQYDDVDGVYYRESISNKCIPCCESGIMAPPVSELCLWKEEAFFNHYLFVDSWESKNFYERPSNPARPPLPASVCIMAPRWCDSYRDM